MYFPINHKQCICKHITGLFILLKIVGEKMPLSVKSVPNVQKRALGGPRHALKPLIHQTQLML